MPSNFFTPVEEREKIFCTELVQCGVLYEKAVTAAKILASGQPDELLSSEDRKVVKDACEKWFVQNKPYKC
ncbi:MAG: hypothetical protein RMY64_22725 [Nostoc sp. DedQUE08]|uniref:hypothetical protein n=1 Tax=unclassified Nostoc TaxID=2593658 RepID=UPI002AD28D40|nr:MULTISPECIES: hypothetical protein [unclassified Nostoc]MDZ8033153.1 hypothetical protein [Nostoc sp. DedSLP04]MDZ8068407.1 hypothetical protein [Nostoc sp. DedQUE08]MDZ8093147.1 hypothetical protein [Nostoc sp. DedQUE05]MDZ8129490.1 hypothetical protein [Nostoc sp. DedQUE07]